MPFIRQKHNNTLNCTYHRSRLLGLLFVRQLLFQKLLVRTFGQRLTVLVQSDFFHACGGAFDADVALLVRHGCVSIPRFGFWMSIFIEMSGWWAMADGW